MVKSAYEFMEKSKRIKNFMRLLGLTDEQYSNDRVELYISLLADVYGRCDLHSLFELENATEGVSNFYDGSIWATLCVFCRCGSK